MNDRYELLSIYPCIYNYISFFPSFNIILECITGNHMLTLSYIFFNVNIFSTFIRYIWLKSMYIMPIFITPHCNVTMPLVQHCVITNVLLYGVSYLYTELLVSMTLSKTFWLLSTILLFIFVNLFLFSLMHYFTIHLMFIGIIISNPNTNWSGL